MTKQTSGNKILGQNQLLEKLIDNLPSMVYLKDTEGRLLACSQSLADFLKIPRAEAIGKTSMELLPPDIAQKQTLDDSLVIATGNTLKTEESIKTPEGDYIYHTVKLPIFDEDGKIFGLCGISTDITEQKQAEEAMRKKTAEMEQLTYSVSHDMRSPLVTIKTFLGYLEQDLEFGKTERIAEDLRFVRDAADKMELMLSELLEYSRVGRISDAPTEINFNQLVDEALAAVAGKIAELNVVLQIEKMDLTLYGEHQRFAQIWQNLLDNATKYMGEQTAPQIHIGAELCGNETVFFIHDNGIGVSVANCEKIFTMFTKLDTRTAGAGLGLATVKRIVEMYGGRIWVESSGEGGGACFKFTLPGALKSER